MAWPKGRKLSASHKAAISRSLKGRSKLGRPANRRTGRATKAIVKRTLSGAKKLATDHPRVVGNAIGVAGAFYVINSRGSLGARASAERALIRVGRGSR